MEDLHPYQSNKPITFQGGLRAVNAQQSQSEIQPPKRPRSAVHAAQQLADSELRVLVINASQDMAKEITLELTLALPGCSIMFAPTLALAKSILARREINLVVSSQILPDGNIAVLKEALSRKQKRPDLVVIGGMTWPLAKALEIAGYRLSASKDLTTPINRMAQIPAATNHEQQIAPGSDIKELGADLRNDLNNPLQEIVAMVFVAKQTQGSSGVTGEALEAIDRAAKNLASVVKGIEDRIRSVVSSKR